MPRRPSARRIATSTRTYVADSPFGGRGVFAAEAMQAGEVVETAPVMVIPAEEIEALEGTPLRDHWYGWGEDGEAAVGLGHASFYNHDPDPTCEYDAHELIDALVIRLRRDVAANQELTIDYTGGGVNELWFEPR